MKCRYCEKEIATQSDYDATPEGEGEHLCWSDFAQPCMDAEEALDVARKRIAELEAEIKKLSGANDMGESRAIARTLHPIVGNLDSEAQS